MVGTIRLVAFAGGSEKYCACEPSAKTQARLTNQQCDCPARYDRPVLRKIQNKWIEDLKTKVGI